MATHRPAPGRFIPRPLVSPVQAFLGTEASGGIVLLVAAAVAIAVANSPLRDNYRDLWHREMLIDTDIIVVRASLLHWINDGLMALFFFLVGLEIKREVLFGELSSWRRASMPVFAAIGGMAVPALIYALVNGGGVGASGWGIPMATDIAFAVAVLALLGRKAPLSLRVFMLALAIADDVGAIAVIVVFYTDSVSIVPLIWAAVALAFVLGVRRAGVRSILAYVPIGLALWLAIYESGIHATLAGIILAVLTPARPLYPPEALTASMETLLRARTDGSTSPEEQLRSGALRELERLVRDSESPLERLELALHGWVSYLILPVFAFANAGVQLSTDSIQAAAESEITWGVALGLVIGKPLGIFGATVIALRLGLGALPNRVDLLHILGAGLLAGIGFTVALFVTNLAFSTGELQNEAKVGIVAASLVAGLAGLALLWIAPGEPDADRSTM